MTTAHVADTGFVVALGRPENERYRSVRTVARRNGLAFLLPERVYEELTAGGDDTVPVETAIDEGWIRVADPLDYTESLVSETMDGVQRYIANADDRREDEVERADAALGGLAAQLLARGTATKVYLYTTDVAAGNAVETVLSHEGYGDAITFVDGFAFVEDLVG